MRVRLAKLMLTCGVLIVGASASALEGIAWAGSPNGVSGSMPAYYDHKVFTINFFQLTTAQATLLAKNHQQNTIYQSDPGLPGGEPFISVIDAIPADGMNPLWAEVQIGFTPGHAPRQLFSDNEIAAAFASGEITLTPTNEMYRCSVIGAVAPVTTRSIAASSSGSSPTIARAASSTASAPSATAASGMRVASWGAIKTKYR